MDLVNSHNHGVCKRKKVKKRKLQKVLRLAFQEDAIDTKNETNFSLQHGVSAGDISARPGAFVITNKARQKGKDTLKSGNVCVKEKLGNNCKNVGKNFKVSGKLMNELMLGSNGNSNSDNLAHASGNNYSKKKEQCSKRGDVLYNNHTGLLKNKNTDKTKSESPYNMPDKKEGNNEVKFPTLKDKSVINNKSKSTAKSLVNKESFKGNSEKAEKNYNKKKRTNGTNKRCLRNITHSEIQDPIPNESNVNRSVKEANSPMKSEGEVNVPYSINSRSKSEKMQKKVTRNTAEIRKKVMRKNGVEVSEKNADCAMKEDYDISCSVENDKPLKLSKNVYTEIFSASVDRTHQREEKQHKDSVLAMSMEHESMLNNRLPICIEMDGEVSVPSKFFNSSTDFYCHSVNSIASGDNELFCRKLNNVRKVETENWEIKVVNINPINSSLLNNVTRNEDLKRRETERKRQDDEMKIKTEMPFRLFCFMNNQMVLILPPGKTVNLRGVLKLRILLGSIKVLGYEMSKDETRTLYSPFGFTFLKIFNNFVFTEAQEELNVLKNKYNNELNEISSKHNEIEKNLKNVPTFSTLILLESAAPSLIGTFRKFIPELIFKSFSPSTITKRLRADIVESEESNSKDEGENENTRMYGKSRLHEEEEWDKIANQLAEFIECNPGGFRCATFGGKGVGKSTFLRFIVNRMLTRKQKVLFIDLDPGQCEFTVPGCLSAVVIDEPLLGPNFTHFTQPARCVYFGEIQVANQVTAYLECVKYIYDWCSSQEYLANIPWCINTMGFPRGFGLDIAHYTINLIQPTHVVQIESGWPLNNFECLLNSNNVKKNNTRSITFNTKWDLMYDFYSLKSGVEMENEEDSIKTWPPYVLRNFGIVAYFNSVLLDSKSLLNVVPYVVRFADIKLCVCHEKINHSDYLNAMNANVVALCNVGSGKGLIPSEPGYPEIWTRRPIGPCYGMGIVRGVDMQEQVIFLVSPLSREELNNVNCLVLGAVTMPPKMILAQDEAEGEIPYVMKGLHRVLHNLGMQGKEWDA